MATTIAVRPIGPTYAISVAATQTTAVAVTANQATQWNYAEFYNSGTTQVCVCVSQLPATGTAATPGVAFPVAGTPTVPTTFMLPGSMTQPRVVAVPVGQNTGFSVTAIGSAAGPSIIYITPVEQI